MVKPDVEYVHAEYSRVYYNGRVYDLNRMAIGWVLTRQCHFDMLAVHESKDDVISRLASQLV